MSLGATMGDAVEKAAPGAAANGASAAQPAAADAAKSTTRPRDARQTRFAQSFAQIVAVLMRDPNFRNMRLADLEWLVLPPVMAGQFRLAQAPSPQGHVRGQEGGVLVPVAVAVWARVSPQIDKQLSEKLDAPVRLRADQWASGNIPWLMAAAGNPRAVPQFLKQLAEGEFRGQQVKMRMRGPDGKVVIKTLGQAD